MNLLSKTLVLVALVLAGCADSHTPMPAADAETPLCVDTCVVSWDDVCVEPGPPDCGGPGCVVGCDVELNDDGSCDVPYWDCGEDLH